MLKLMLNQKKLYGNGFKMPRKKQATEKGKAKEKTKKFNLEFKKTLNTAIVAAFGFIIGLVWKDVIMGYVEELTAVSPVQGKLISALIITFIGVLGIIIVTKFLRVEE